MATRRTGLWLLATFLVFVSFFALFAWGLNRMLLGGAPAVRSRTVLRVKLQGPVGEVRAGGPFEAPLTVREIDEAIRRAADDRRVTGLLLEVGPLGGGFAKVQEIRSAVAAFRRTDKPAFALLEVGSILDLYLASAADTVYQVPSGQLLLGLLVQGSFYRDLLDKVGIQFEAFHTGPYKTAMHSLTNRTMTAEQREMEEDLLDSIYSRLLEDVAADRDIGIGELEAAVDRGLLSAAQAKTRGLIDELGYRSDLLERLEKASGGEAQQMDVRPYLRATETGFLSAVLSGAPVIALVHVSGLMVPGEFEDSLFGGDVAAGNTIARYLREAREDDAVRAIVLRIDSPGGAVTAADVMGREARLAAEKKPLIVSMSDVAASGGYWLASYGSHVYADPGTYTGSIGVLMGRVNLQRTYEILGIRHELLQRGANADLLSEVAPLRPEQITILEENLQEAYAEFIRVVAEGRHMDPSDVEAVAAGRVWTGEQALEKGLVDELGGLREALARASTEAGIGAGRPVRLRIYPPRRSFLQQLTQLFSSTAVRTDYPPVAGIRDLFERLRLLGASGPVWALMDAPLPEAVR